MTCPNGFFLKRSYDDTISKYSVKRATDDICVKCHSTCKQCKGPEIDQCTACFKLFKLDSISYDRTCILCIENKKARPADVVPD